MTDSPCPQQDELLHYMSGRLDEEQADSVALHIDTCAICNETVSTLNPGADPLVAELQQASPPSFSGEPECAAALNAIADEPPVSSTKKSPTTKSPFDLPKTIREYRLIEQIGRGGMGAVFKAEHVRLKRLVAVKVLLGDRLHDDSAVARFDREMEAVGKLDHPNIVRATDAGEDEDTHYLVMELVDGPNLSQLSKSLGPINVADACEVVRQAAAGLQHAHEHGLVHRDIKPSNLILADGGSLHAFGNASDNSGNATVKILDLGLALLRENPAEHDGLTSSGQVMGTLDYMAPEQASDTHSVDIRADIYSLGCTLYHLLAGSAPFSGSQYSTILKKMMAHAKSPVPRLSEVRSDVPAELSAILDRMLAKEPAERFSTPGEILATLHPFVGDADLPALLNRYRSAHKSVQHLDTQLQSTITPVSSALSDTIDPVAQPNSASSPTPKVQTDSQLASEPFAPTIIVDAPPQSFANRDSGRGKGYRGNHRRTWQLLAACGGVLLAGIVFFVGTGEGRVEITVNHPDVKVSVDGEPHQIKVLDGTTDEYRIELPNIPAGRREIVVTRDGFSAETRHFWITRNGERAFEMRLVPDASGSNTNTAVIASRDAQSKLDRPEAAISNNLGPAENVLPGVIPRPSTIAGIKRWNIESRSIRTAVLKLACSPDGELLACGTLDGRVRIFDLHTRELVSVLSESNSLIKGLEWSPDSQRLAVGSSANLITVWTRDGLVAWSRESDNACIELEWSQDGKILATATMSQIVIFSAKGEVTQKIDATGHGLSSLSLAPDGLNFVTGSHQGVVSFWDRQKGLLNSLDAHDGSVTCVAWSPTANMVASGGNGDVQFRDTTGNLVATSDDHRSQVSGLAWNADGSKLVSVSMEGTICQWDPKGNQLRKDWNVVGRNPQAIEWSADNSSFVIGGGACDLTWFGNDGQELSQLAGFEGEIGDIRWDGKGGRFATNARDSLVRIHSENGDTLTSFSEQNNGRSIAWSPDDSQLSVPTLDSNVAIWNVSRKQREKTLRTGRPNSAQFSIDWNRENGDLAVAEDSGTVTIWRSKDHLNREVRQHRGPVYNVRWIPGTDRLASVGTKADFQIGKPGSPSVRPESAANVIRGLACSSDGKHIATLEANASILEIWNSEGKLLTSKHFPNVHLRKAMDWTKDQLILSSHDGGLLRVDQTGRVKLARPMHHTFSEALDVHPDGEFGISTDVAGTIIKWDTGTLDPEWVLVTMPEGESLKFSAAGEFLRGDRELFEREFVYVIEDETGRRHLLTPSEFEQRRSRPGDFSVSDESADQSLVKWVHDRGGIIINNGVQIHGSLKPGQKLTGIRIKLTGDEFEDESIRDLIRRIPESANSLELEIDSVAVTSNCFKYMTDMPVLRSLVMRKSTIDPQQIASLKNRRLIVLGFVEARLTKAVNGQIDWSGLPNLENLTLGTNKGELDFHLDDDCLRHITNSFQRLLALTLMRTTITDDGLSVLKSRPSLMYLNLKESLVSDQGIETIVRNHPSLTRLELDSSLITGKSIDKLSNLKNLAHLAIPDCSRIDSEGFSKLSSLTNLERLIVTTTSFGDDDIEGVTKLPNLHHLVARQTKITDKGLDDLAGVKTLETIALEGASVTVEGIAKLKARLPNCTIQSHYTEDEVRAALGSEERN